MLGGSAGFYVGEDVELGQGFVAGGGYADLTGLDLELGLGEIGAAGEGLLDEVLEGCFFEEFGNGDAVGGDDLREGCGEEGGIGAEDLIAEDDLLLAVEALSLGERELRRGDESRDTGELDGGEGAFDDLIGVVVAELAGGAESFFVDGDVFAKGYEVKVDTGDAVDGFEDLLLEEEARDLFVFVGDADVAGVDAADATEERLGEGDGGAGGREGIALGVGAVDDGGVVVDGGFQLGSGVEALEVGDVGGDEGEGLGSGDGGAAGSGAGCCPCAGPGSAAEGNGVGAAEIAGFEEEAGIEEGDGGAGAVLGAGGGAGGEVGGGLGGCVEGGQVCDGGGGGVWVGGGGVQERGAGASVACWGLGDRVVDAAEGASTCGASAVGVGEEEVVAFDFNVEVVFYGEDDGVAGAEVELVVADERTEAVAVAGEELGDLRAAEGAEEAAADQAGGGGAGGSGGWGSGEGWWGGRA